MQETKRRGFYFVLGVVLLVFWSFTTFRRREKARVTSPPSLVRNDQRGYVAISSKQTAFQGSALWIHDSRVY